MRATEPGFGAFDPDRLEIDQHSLGLARHQRVSSLRTDSAHYPGLTMAGGEGLRQGRAGAALAFEEARCSNGLGGC